MKILLKKEIRQQFEDGKHNKVGVLTTILRDTILYYGKNPSSRRNKTESECLYSPITETSEGCAVGRLLTPLCAKFLDANSCDITVGNEPYEWDENIVEHKTFFKMLQSLHDTDVNWADEGLSEEGEGARGMIQTYIYSQYGG